MHAFIVRLFVYAYRDKAMYARESWSKTEINGALIIMTLRGGSSHWKKPTKAKSAQALKSRELAGRSLFHCPRRRQYEGKGGNAIRPCCDSWSKIYQCLRSKIFTMRVCRAPSTIKSQHQEYPPSSSVVSTHSPSKPSVLPTSVR